MVVLGSWFGRCSILPVVKKQNTQSMWRGLTSWVWVRIFKDFPSSLKVWEDQLYICVGEKTCYLPMDTLEIFQYISVLLTFVVIFLILTLFIKRKHFICCTCSVSSLPETERETPASLQGVTWISISEPTDLPTYEELKLNGDLSSPPPSYWSLYPFRIYYDQPVVIQTVWVRIQVSIISITSTPEVAIILLFNMMWNVFLLVYRRNNNLFISQ